MYFLEQEMMMFPDMQGLGFYHGNYQNQGPHLCQGTSSVIDSLGSSSSCSSNSYHGHFPAISDSSVNNLLEYDLGGEGDLFKAPEPIIEEPEVPLDPVTAAFSMMSGGELIDEDTLKITDTELIGNDQLLSDFFYECKKDILATSATGEPFCELSDVKMSPWQKEVDHDTNKGMLIADGPIQKSVSSDRLASMDWNKGRPLGPNFLDFEEMGLVAALRIRRAHSEGDIQTLGSGDTSFVNQNALHPPPESMLAMDKFKSEERRKKLSRYRNKKKRRNFGRKIKYACRKALADNQLRVRGRFAKIKEREVSKPFK